MWKPPFTCWQMVQEWWSSRWWDAWEEPNPTEPWQLQLPGGALAPPKCVEEDTTDSDDTEHMGGGGVNEWQNNGQNQEYAW